MKFLKFKRDKDYNLKHRINVMYSTLSAYFLGILTLLPNKTFILKLVLLIFIVYYFINTHKIINLEKHIPK